KTSQQLLREEAQRYPAWEPTLGATRDSDAKLARKTRELELADLVICPSEFVRRSLPAAELGRRPCLVVPFGSPAVDLRADAITKNSDRPLRVLFAGAMSQRKGLADLFLAMKLLDAKTIELIVM